jgi:hypothetical protein
LYRSNCYPTKFGSKVEEPNTCIAPSRTDRPISALPRLDDTQENLVKDKNIQKKICELHSSWIGHTNGNSVVATDLSRRVFLTTGIYTDSFVTTNHLAESRSIDVQIKCVKIVKDNDAKSKRPEKPNKAIDPDLKYLEQSRSLLSTANGKIDDNSYYMTRSWASWPSRTYYLTERHEEDKIICDEAAISCEAELLSDPYGQIRKGHLAVEEGILEAILGVEDERSHDPRSYSHVGGFKLCSRFDPDDETSFIQASSNALLPDEASSTPLLEVVSLTFLKPNFWICEANPVP